MDDKLKKWEGLISDKLKTPCCSGRGSIPTDTLVSLTVSEDKQGCRSILRVSFCYRLLSLTGWQDKDRLDMLIKGDEVVVFRSEKGRILCKSVGKAHVRRYLRFALAQGSFLGFPTGCGRNVEAGPGKVAFLLPLPQKI